MLVPAERGPADAEDSTRRDRCLHQAGLEPFRNQVRHRHRRPAQEPVSILLIEIAEFQSEFADIQIVLDFEMVHVRRRHRKQGPGNPADLSEARVKFAEFLCIMRRDAFELVRGGHRILVDAERTPFKIHGQDANIRIDHHESMLIKLQLFGNAPEQRTGRMGEGRTKESGRQLLGDCRSANHRAALQHQRSKPGFSQVAGGHQTVMPSANHHDRLSLARHYRFQSLKIFLAAFSPDAPIMPPPGCVADPHI